MGIHSNTASKRFWEDIMFVINMYIFATTAATKIGMNTILYNTNPKNSFVSKSYPNIAAV